MVLVLLDQFVLLLFIKGSPIDRVDRALGDPRSIESIRSSPKGSPNDRVDRALGDPRRKVEAGSRMRQLKWIILWWPRAGLGGELRY